MAVTNAGSSGAPRPSTKSTSRVGGATSAGPAVIGAVLIVYVVIVSRSMPSTLRSPVRGGSSPRTDDDRPGGAVVPATAVGVADERREDKGGQGGAQQRPRDADHGRGVDRG